MSSQLRLPPSCSYANNANIFAARNRAITCRDEAVLTLGRLALVRYTVPELLSTNDRPNFFQVVLPLGPIASHLASTVLLGTVAMASQVAWLSRRAEG